MKKLFTAILALVLMCFAFTGCGGDDNGGDSISGSLTASADFSTGFKQTTATDDYGRTFSAVTDYNENVVGIFYFLWLSQCSTDTNVDSYVEKGRVESTLTGDEVAMMPEFTYWGEPMYGFYQVEDEWVVRKHVELFINAGLDFICFDSTNNDYYQAAAMTVLNVLLEYQNMGYDVPKAMFMTNSDSTTLTDNIYNAFYRRNTYDSIWFCGNGSKPWILADYGGSNQDVLNRFYFKKAQWPNRTYGSNNFPWVSWHYPQETYTDSASNYTIMSVSTSQHTGIGGGYSDEKVSGVNFSLSGLFAPYNYNTLSDALRTRFTLEQATKYYNNNWGRGYSHRTKSNSFDNVAKNVNFEEQWESVYGNSAVNLVFITGWNEWIAQKQSKDPLLGVDYGYYVDTFSMEFSRDVEMMKDGYLDNCFLQMVKNIRKFKGSGHAGNVAHAKVSDSTNLLSLSNWKNVASYADLVGETAPRDHMGAGNNWYTNDTGRNDIREVRVASNSQDVYFLITTVDDITAKAATDTRWMNLYVGVNGSDEGWNNLQYVINRSLDGTTASLDRIADNGFASAGSCQTYVSGKHMIVKVSKSALGITGDSFTLSFKVCDNLQKDFDITELYTNGDCAPIGRINYSYYTK